MKELIFALRFVSEHFQKFTASDKISLFTYIYACVSMRVSLRVRVRVRVREKKRGISRMF